MGRREDPDEADIAVERFLDHQDAKAWERDQEEDQKVRDYSGKGPWTGDGIRVRREPSPS